MCIQMKRQTNAIEMKVTTRWMMGKAPTTATTTTEKILQFVTVQSTNNRIKQYWTFNDVVWESTTDSSNNSDDEKGVFHALISFFSSCREYQ